MAKENKVTAWSNMTLDSREKIIESTEILVEKLWDELKKDQGVRQTINSIQGGEDALKQGLSKLMMASTQNSYNGEELKKAYKEQCELTGTDPQKIKEYSPQCQELLFRTLTLNANMFPQELVTSKGLEELGISSVKALEAIWFAMQSYNAGVSFEIKEAKGIDGANSLQMPEVAKDICSTFLYSAVNKYTPNVDTSTDAKITSAFKPMILKIYEAFKNNPVILIREENGQKQIDPLSFASEQNTKEFSEDFMDSLQPDGWFSSFFNTVGGMFGSVVGVIFSPLTWTFDKFSNLFSSKDSAVPDTSQDEEGDVDLSGEETKDETPE